jgi:hypothetical protein
MRQRAIGTGIVLLVLMLSAAATGADARAAKESRGDFDPLQAVSAISTWLRDLVADFDAVVAKEKRGQLVRSVDRLRKALYQLEADTRILIDSVTDHTPTEDESRRLSDNAAALRATVEGLKKQVRAIGADVRLADRSQEIEQRLTGGLITRAGTLNWLQEQLKNVRLGRAQWKAEQVRERLRTGLAAVQDAQLAATDFQIRLTRN